MNEVIRQLYDRKSIRVYLDREIEKEKKDAILRAAAQAPTAGNQQLYTILDITDQSLKEKLVETCDHQPMIAQAKMVLIFCADCKKWYDAYLSVGCQTRKPGVGDLMLAAGDAMMLPKMRSPQQKVLESVPATSAISWKTVNSSGNCCIYRNM